MPSAAEPDTPAPFAARLRDALEVVNTPFRFVQDAMRFPRSEGRMARRIELTDQLLAKRTM